MWIFYSREGERVLFTHMNVHRSISWEVFECELCFCPRSTEVCLQAPYFLLPHPLYLFKIIQVKGFFMLPRIQ